MRDVAAVHGKDTESIWNRQVRRFWEIAWVIGTDGDLLGRRKNWRSFVPTVEPGDKCFLNPHLQELSGYLQIDKEEREAQDAFWAALRKKTGEYDLAENERLSAIALIKRLFPRVAEEAVGWSWLEEAIYFPSNTYLAALPWIQQAVKKAPEEAARFARQVLVLDRQLENRQGRRFFQGEECREFVNLEGPVYFRNGLENLLRDLTEPPSPEQTKAVKQAYDELKEKAGEPSPYYAVLIMDGDRLGALLQSREVDGGQLSEALALFSGDLGELVRKRDGALVYAGGDDVLAMVSVETVLDLAIQLRERYVDSFKRVLGETRFANLEKKRVRPSISAAVVLAHYYTPLQGVVRYAHELLDGHAKEKSGRDSIAIGVWKRSGPDLVWSAPWEVLYERGEGEPVTLFDRLNVHMEGEEEVSSHFLYKVSGELDGTGRFTDDPEENWELMVKLIAADFVRIKGKGGPVNVERAERMAEALLELCFRSYYDGERNLRRREPPFRPDGALLAQFLKRRGEGRA
jgi:CRISPR-associated protein Cmr2